MTYPTRALQPTVVLVALLFSASLPASIGLYSTGVDDDGNPIADNGEDPHYALFYSGRDHDYSTAYVTTDNPVGWLAAGPGYQWINPTGDGNDNLPCRYGDCDVPVSPYAHADYFYTTGFDLTGIDPDTVYIAFDVAADNAVNVDINGRYIGRIDGYAAFQTVVLDDPAWFVTGVNTIRFGVANTANFFNPTGLMVRVLVAEVRIPEPATLVLVGLGIVAFALGLRRRSRPRQSG